MSFDELLNRLPPGQDRLDIAADLLRYAMTTSEIGLLDTVIDLLTDGLAAGPAHRAWHLSNLCLAHRERHRCGGGPADLDRAVEIGEQSIAAADDGDPNRAAYLSNLGIALRERYAHRGDPRDLDRSVEVGEQALAATPDGHPDRALYLSKLGTAYRLRAERHGTPADARRAVEFGARAVESTPDDPTFLANLGNAYVERFEHSHDPADLDRAIEVGERGAAHGLGLANLGGAYQRRYERDGNPDDLDRAIELGERAIAEAPERHPRLAGYLSNLGGCYQQRHDRTGAIGDLDRAVVLAERAVDAAPDDHVSRALYLCQLGAAYQQRYERSGALADLDHAVRVGEQAVTVAPRDHPNRALCLSNLGLAAWKRYLRGEDPADLDRAIEVGERAVAAARPGDPAGIAMRSNLGSAYLARFADRRASADIDHAVDAARDVVQAAADNHPDRATYLSNLGNSYLQRYEHRRAADDLRRALDAAERAITTSRPDHPARATHLANLCVILLRRYDLTGTPVESLGRLIEWLAEVKAAGTATPTSLIKAGHRLGALAHAMNDQAAAVALLRDAVALLPVAVAGQAERGDQEHRLGAHWGMIGEAVAAFCAAGDPVGAVETAELGRGILLASTLDSRTEPRPPRFADLRAAAASGAVVLVNAGRYRGDAIIITADGPPILVHLPNLTWADTEKYTEQLLAATYDGGEMGVRRPERPVVPDILRWLWTSAVEPILDALPAPNKRRVWWLPIGMLGLFPLHAADGAQHAAGGALDAVGGALDAVVSSYTPTLRALADARARKPAARHQLAVAVGDTPGLPGTAAEIAELRADPALVDRAATVDAVLAALPAATWAHFSCHAGIDLLVPSRGGLRLSDGVLPVAAISRLRLDTAELAYLSACATSHRGIRHADESIHLASAFQSAGFRHVIAGLWPLNDRVAVRAARLFYRAMPDGAAADDAAAVLRDVTIALRSRYPDQPAAWAGLIHSGP